MKHLARLCLSALVAILGACASIHDDHFYVLQPIPAGAAVARDTFGREITVQVSLPSMVDRNQMVLLQNNGIVVLEHERWAAPLVDQVTRVLGQDIEQRRPDILVTTRPQSQAAGVPRTAIHVDVVELSLQQRGAARLEARWHVDAVDGVKTGRTTFSANAGGASPAAWATAVSQCVAQLADQLVPLIGNSASQPR